LSLFIGHPAVKPIDKILPRKIMAHFGTSPCSVHISTRPTFFRAPMLTSKIHAKWDAGFCQSTQYQLDKICKPGMTWSDLWLTASEKAIVQYHDEHGGKWLTLGELETMEREKSQQTAAAATTAVGATNSIQDH
jgi:hypothetical protein